MRLRILLTDGSRTVDLYWLVHTGTDVYYGAVGDEWKDSYHASGKRHMKSAKGGYGKIDPHHRLDDFKGQLQLVTFGFPRNMVESGKIADFTGKKADALVMLDSRTLPEFVNASVGLLEPGNYSEMLPVQLVCDLRQVVIVTSTVPWIYVMVINPASVDEYLARLGASP